MLLTIQSTNTIMPDVTDWLTIEEASEESGYHPEWLRELLRKYQDASNPPLKFVKKGGIWLIEPNSLREYVKWAKKAGSGKHDPTRKPHKQ